MNELNIKTFVDKIEEIRTSEIKFQHTIKATDPYWIFLEGRITSLTNILYWYYGKKTKGNNMGASTRQE